MRVKGVTAEQVAELVEYVSVQKYNGNLTTRTLVDQSNARTNWAQFTLRTRDSAGKGAKGSAGWNSSGTGPHGLHRTVGACWHAHYDVLAEVFRAYPNAEVKGTLLAPLGYNARNFHDEAMATKWLNVGSQIMPRTPTELCECVGHRADYIDLLARNAS